MFSNRILRFALVVLSLLVPSASDAYEYMMTGAPPNACTAAIPDTAWYATPQLAYSAWSAYYPRGCANESYSITNYVINSAGDSVAITFHKVILGVASDYTVNKSIVVQGVSCPVADTLHSKGFFNVGLSPAGKLLNTACIASCGVYLRNGHSPAASSLLNGKRYYFGSAEYHHTGQSCSPDTPNFLSDFVGNLPSGTCAPGQSFITMNGVTKCINSGTGEDVNAASAAAAAKTLLDQRAAAAASAAQAAATMAGASASDAVAAGVRAAADTAANDAGLLDSTDPETAAFCKDNPDASICASQEFGEVADATLQEKTINVAITPFAVGGAGYCPAPTPLLNKQGKQYYFEWTVYCNYATGIKPIILAFAWLAAAGILVGGFRAA